MSEHQGEYRVPDVDPCRPTGDIGWAASPGTSRPGAVHRVSLSQITSSRNRWVSLAVTEQTGGHT
ncbi:MAG TPA: hypothetical protein VGI36_14165 [Candidatus Binataceae bacterium]